MESIKPIKMEEHHFVRWSIRYDSTRTYKSLKELNAETLTMYSAEEKSWKTSRSNS